MKKLLLSAFALTLLVACGGSDAVQTTDVTPSDSSKVETSKPNVETSSYSVNTEKSVLGWTGSAVGKSHNGTVNITSGALNVANGSVVNGEFVFDMTSINVLDLEGEWKGKLETHLADSTFFGIEKFPTSSLKITSVTEGKINADLTIKNVTKSIVFPATITVTDYGVEASAKFTINRTDFGVVYGSGSLFDIAKDKAISDDIDFDVTVSTSK